MERIGKYEYDFTFDSELTKKFAALLRLLGYQSDVDRFKKYEFYNYKGKHDISWILIYIYCEYKFCCGFLNFEIFFEKIDLVDNKTKNGILKSVKLLNNDTTSIEDLNYVPENKLQLLGFGIGDIIHIQRFF